MNKIIGLFGTCGASTWRKMFITVYEKIGIQFFNPQKEDWAPEDAQIEAEHLASDDIVLFPVTGDTYGSGSLAEVGFAVANAMNSNQKVIIFIADSVSAELTDTIAIKESMRARALVKAHLTKIKHENVIVVNSMDEMLTTSLTYCKLI